MMPRDRAGSAALVSRGNHLLPAAAVLLLLTSNFAAAAGPWPAAAAAAVHVRGRAQGDALQRGPRGLQPPPGLKSNGGSVGALELPLLEASGDGAGDFVTVGRFCTLGATPSPPQTHRVQVCLLLLFQMPRPA